MLRRSILKGLLGLLAVPAAGLAAGRPAAAAAPAHGFHLVNGWVLTDRDVAALDGRREPPPAPGAASTIPTSR